MGLSDSLRRLSSSTPDALGWDDTMAGPGPRMRKNNEIRDDSPLHRQDSMDSDTEYMKQRRRSAELQVSEQEARQVAQGLTISIPKRAMEHSVSMPGSLPSSLEGSPIHSPAGKDNIWRSVFNPGSPLPAKKLGSSKFDNAPKTAPSVYDWMYRGETRSEWR